MVGCGSQQPELWFSVPFAAPEHSVSATVACASDCFWTQILETCTGSGRLNFVVFSSTWPIRLTDCSARRFHLLPRPGGRIARLYTDKFMTPLFKVALLNWGHLVPRGTLDSYKGAASENFVNGGYKMNLGVN